MNQTTIIFVTYNSSHLLSSVLPQLNGYKTLVFDNNSVDDTVHRCQQESPNTEIIANKINIGYGRAANAAIKHINTPYAFLVNPDVSINTEQLDALEDSIKKIEGDWFYIAPNTGHAVADIVAPPTDNMKRISHATGCALLFNVEKFLSLGGFDENIFLYYEEMDLSMRAKNEGLEMYYAENIEFPHNSKQSVAYSDDLETLRNWHFQWSSLYYKKKHALWGRLIEGLFKNLILSLARQAFSNKKNSAKYQVKRKATQAFIQGKKAFSKDGQPFNPAWNTQKK
jgi:N-acetylglucosaminyl-diphospho-decaprenol L-rhamnosyltransferase